MSEFIELKLENASLGEISELAQRAIYPNVPAKKTVDVKTYKQIEK